MDLPVAAIDEESDLVLTTLDLKAAEVAKESAVTGRSIREIVLEKGYLKPQEVDNYLSPEKLTEPGIPGEN